MMDLPEPAGPSTRTLEPRSTPPPRSAFSSLLFDLSVVPLEVRLVLGRDEPRKYTHAACLDDEIVIAAGEPSRDT